MAGWANSLSAGEIDSSLEYGFFMVAVELTDIGQGKLPSWFQPKGHAFYCWSLLTEISGIQSLKKPNTDLCSSL